MPDEITLNWSYQSYHNLTFLSGRALIEHFGLEAEMPEGSHPNSWTLQAAINTLNNVLDLRDSPEARHLVEQLEEVSDDSTWTSGYVLDELIEADIFTPKEPANAI